MYENIDDLVDKNLPLFLENKRNILGYDYLKGEGDQNLSFHQAKPIADYMESKDLVEQNGDFITLTEYGYEIAKVGWLNYLSLLKQREEAKTNLEETERLYTKQKEAIETKNLIANTQLAEWQVRTKYLPYIFSILGLVVSCVALYISIKSNTKTSTESQVPISEKELTKDNTLISTQTKKGDSLHNAKIQLDSLTIK